MSETVTYIGKLKKVDLNGKTVEEWCDEKCQELNIEVGGYYKTAYEALRSENNYKYFFHGDDVWETIENKKSEYEDICFITPNLDGTYTFVMQFYNGGTCLDEMIEEGLNEMNK